MALIQLERNGALFGVHGAVRTKKNLTPPILSETPVFINHRLVLCYREPMPRTREEILEERRQLKAEYGELFDSITTLLFRHDPIGINFEINPDEYQYETGTILPRLRTCESCADVLRVVHEEFSRWFGIDTAGSVERYSQIADDIWQLWQARRRIGPNGQGF